MKKKHHSQSKAASADQKMIDGIAKHMGKSGTTQLRGKKYKPSELVAMLKARIEQIARAKSARAAWRKANAEKDAALAETDEIVLALKHHLLVAYGDDVDVLEDFGLAPKAKKAATVVEKYVAVRKAEATRNARAQHGAPDATTPAPTPTAPAHPSTTNGTSTIPS